MSSLENAKQITDGLLGAAALTVPLWVQNLTNWIGVLMALGGLVLLLVRIMIAIREYRYKRKTMKID